MYHHAASNIFSDSDCVLRVLHCQCSVADCAWHNTVAVAAAAVWVSTDALGKGEEEGEGEGERRHIQSKVC